MVDVVQTLPNSKNDLILALVQKELSAGANLMPFISNLTAFVGKGMKTISVPKLSNFTVTNRALGAKGDATALTDAKDTIALDFNAYIAWIEDHADHFQSTIDYRIEASSRAASAMGRYVDAQLIAKLSAISSLNINGAVAGDIAVDDILAMRAHILGKNGKLENMVLVVGVDQETAMLKLPEFVRADYYGNSNIPNGMIGRVYGVPVLINNQIPASQAFMFDKDGIGAAFQIDPSMSEQSANEYGTMSKRVAVDQLFGVGGLQLGVGGVGATLSPLVAKLKD